MCTEAVLVVRGGPTPDEHIILPAHFMLSVIRIYPAHYKKK